MRRQYNWVPIILILVAMLGYKVGWPWYRDRADNAAVDAVIADLDQQATLCRERTAALPDKPAPAEVDELIRLVDAQARLPERAEAAIPRAKGDRLAWLTAALREWADRFRALRARVKQVAPNQAARLGEPDAEPDAVSDSTAR